MMNKVMISLSGRNQAWFDKKSPQEKAEYLKAHPGSSFGKGLKKKANKAKKAAEKAAAPASKTASKKRPTESASKGKFSGKGKTTAKKKSQQRVNKKSVVHPDTSKMHEHALKQKKAAIDALVAPHARELGKLRNKRDTEGLSAEESARYAQLIETIKKLHHGR